MRRLAEAVVAAALLFPLLVAPAAAQATRTWVSGVGDDVNPCSRTAPCKTFAGAISKTAAGGEINCLDSAGYGAVTVTKSMTISCEGVTASILAAGTTGVNFNGAATDTLFLKGLSIEGAGTGINGVAFNTGGALHVEDCVVRGFTGVGIKIKPNAAAKFVVTRTSLFKNGTGATGAGLQVLPSAGATQGLIDRVVADRNVFGIAADGSGGTTGINVTIRDSSISGNSQAGIVAATGAVGVGLMVMRTASVNNATGVQSSGAGALMRVGSSEITGNATGVSGAVQSYGNNQLNGNTSDGVLTPVAGGLH